MDLSLDDDDVQARKMRILRKIMEDIANGCVYENKLQQLEILESLLVQEGLKAPDSMKEAYSAVARECTSKYLVCVEGDKRIYIDAVQRIWLKRIMGLFEKGSSLISTELKNCAKEMKAVMYDEKVCERLREENTRNKALLSLKGFVTEQLTLMGQNSRDILARHPASEVNVCVRETVRGCCESKNFGNEYSDEKQEEDGDRFFDAEMELEKEEQCNGQEDEEDNGGENDGRGRKKRSVCVETGADGKEKVLRHKLRVFEDPSRKACNRQSAYPVKISGNEELDPQPSGAQVNADFSAEHLRVLHDLRTSKVELLGALQPKDVPASQTDNENVNNEILNKKQKDANITDLVTERNLEHARENEPNPSLMDRNHTARTFEWEDSIENAPAEMNSSEEKPHLPSPRRLVLSPLRKNQSTKGANRRRRVAWLPEETEALKEGVARYGRHWKKIKLANPIVLARRTEVDLKDKYRVEMGRENPFGEVSE